MAIPFKNDDLTHIVRTTEQWETTADKYEIIPEGVLCVEFTPSDRTNIKIGNGHKTFRELPYVAGNIDLSLYYTREETDNRILSILNEQKVFRIKGYKKSFNELPANGTEGDVWFVESTSPSEFNIYEKYIWTANNKWEFIGNSNIDIDLSQYAKKEDVENKFNDINLKLQEWVDTEKVHTHLNKEILDKTDAIFDKVKDDKLSSLTNYDDKEIRSKITDLEKTAHTHQNKDILDKTTAPFTIEYERLMPFIREYVGASRFEDGEMGLVPPALAGEQDYILTGAGKWVPNTGGGVYELPIATKTELGGIKIGEGLEISDDGTLTVVGGGSGGGLEYLEGDGIKITGGDLVRLNPIMVSDTVPSGQVIYTGQYATRYGYLAFDGVDSQTYSSHAWTDDTNPLDGTTEACYIGYMFNKSVTIEKFVISFYSDRQYVGVIQVHQDGVWTTVVNNIPVSANPRYSKLELDLNSLITCDGFRFCVISGNGEYFSKSIYGGNVCEFEAYGYLSNQRIINVKPATETEIGGVIIGDGLNIDENGILSVSGEISNETYRAGLGINIEEKPIPGDIELDILNNEYAGWDNFTYLWTGGAEYEETNYVLHTTRDRIADEEGNWLTHFKIPDGVENIKVEAVAKDGTPLKFWIDNHDSETLYRWSLLGRWYDSGETVIYPDEYVPSLLKYNYISIGLCFDTNNTRTISVDDIDYVKLYFIEGDPENPKGIGKYINSDIASEYQLGGVIIGKGINVTEDGVISVDSMPLEPATSDTLGGIKVGNGLEITKDGKLNVIGGGGTGSNCVTDVDLKQDAPGVIVVTKPNETKELDVFQYLTELQINCVEDATI